MNDSYRNCYMKVSARGNAGAYVNKYDTSSLKGLWRNVFLICITNKPACCWYAKDIKRHLNRWCEEWHSWMSGCDELLTKKKKQVKNNTFMFMLIEHTRCQHCTLEDWRSVDDMMFEGSMHQWKVPQSAKQPKTTTVPPLRFTGSTRVLFWTFSVVSRTSCPLSTQTCKNYQQILWQKCWGLLCQCHNSIIRLWCSLNQLFTSNNPRSF